LDRLGLARVRLIVIDEAEQEGDARRPRTRGDCAEGPRPCPWVGCKYNLYLDVRKDGAIAFNFSDLDPDELHPEWSCALDVAERGDISLEGLGAALNVTREGARKIEEKALHHLFRHARSGALKDFDEGRAPRSAARSEDLTLLGPRHATGSAEIAAQPPEQVGAPAKDAPVSMSAERDLTRRERALLRAYRAHIALHGTPPSRIELGLAVGFDLATRASIRSTVYQATRRLVARGLIPKGRCGGPQPMSPRVIAKREDPASEVLVRVDTDRASNDR
jgi:hypothetical protein